MIGASLAYDLENQTLSDWNSNNDDKLLDEMRIIIRDYVDVCVKKHATEKTKKEYRVKYEDIRNKMRDSMLKEYASFEFMEKLYMQECLAE